MASKRVPRGLRDRPQTVRAVPFRLFRHSIGYASRKEDAPPLVITSRTALRRLQSHAYVPSSVRIRFRSERVATRSSFALRGWPNVSIDAIERRPICLLGRMVPAISFIRPGVNERRCRLRYLDPKIRRHIRVPHRVNQGMSHPGRPRQRVWRRFARWFFCWACSAADRRAARLASILGALLLSLFLLRGPP
jgi:hypothetical protein